MTERREIGKNGLRGPLWYTATRMKMYAERFPNSKRLLLCRLEKAGQRIAELERELEEILDLATTLAAEVDAYWSDASITLCDKINALYAARAAEGDK